MGFCPSSLAKSDGIAYNPYLESGGPGFRHGKTDMIIEIDGYKINYKITGAGEETAVILQGWGTSLDLYDSVAKDLSDAMRVVQLDLPGFGGSDEPREPWNVDAYADFFCRFLDALGIRKTSLIGHSYGGRIIIKLAARESLPFELTKIVFVDSAGIRPKRTKKQEFQVKRYKVLKKFLTAKPVHFLFPEVIDDWMSRQGSADYRNASPRMKQCMVLAVNEDLTELLGRIRQECLLIWGDRDTATPISDAEIFRRKIPGAGLAVLKGSGHYAYLEQPALFRRILRTFYGLEAIEGDDA